MMFDSDYVGGADERRKGLGKRIPVNVEETSTDIGSSVIMVQGPKA